MSRLSLALIALTISTLPGTHHDGSPRVLARRHATIAVLPAGVHPIVHPAGQLLPVLVRGGKRPQPSTWLVTAYCIHGATASGERTRPGIIAAGNWLAFGTRIELRIGGKWRQVVVEDRGPMVHRHHLDLWMASCSEAVDWGVREEQGWVRT